MSQGERCLLVHGHFYQPPRENPWTGEIDPQHSAAPWENWNRRIADECYLPMARSRVYNAQGAVVDLYNNYAHTSFNFGPTLLSWAEKTHPRLLRHLADATAFDNTYAMAQAYNHMMLPLADVRDRHTQILWGLREFRHRFGFRPAGMWLPECGVDPETIRALIDHGVRFVILSPHQASKARPFGQRDWRDVSMGAVDTRRVYRLFETDGGGRTHFDRWLDVIFYTPGLNLKVSFDHILNRPDDLARELENCYSPDFAGSQLVSVVTDGEIYGHHEKRGQEALSRLFRDIAPSIGLRIVSAGGFVRDNPPDWEVKLWNGEDGRGSSWSCQHGVGRWHRDCGCHSPTPPGWNQRWRGPVREAFDALRDRVGAVARRELGGLVWDVDDARNGYIDVVLRPTPDSRRGFLRRHARRGLDASELERLWSLMEAMHNAMLMYSSCGWFFDEVSGLEPVQNMRYALRAAELAQPWHDGDLTALLEERLARAESNISGFGNGAKVFHDLVLPTRHDNRELAAAVAVCLAEGVPPHGVSWKLVKKTETVNYKDTDRNRLSWGSFVCLDERLDRFIKTSWVARLDDFDNSAISLHGFEEAQGDPDREPGSCPFVLDDQYTWLRDAEREMRGMTRQELMERISEALVTQNRLPAVIREMLYRRFSEKREEAFLDDVAALGLRAVPFMDRARRNGSRTPELLVTTVTGAFARQMEKGVLSAITDMRFGDAEIDRVVGVRNSAWDLGVGPNQDDFRRAVFVTGAELLHWLSRSTERDWFAGLRPMEIEGQAWLAPESEATGGLRYWSPGGLSMALGRGLALLWETLRERGDVAFEAVRLLPLPELLTFGDRLGMEPDRMVRLGMEFWDYLDRPLARLLRGGREGLLRGELGDRLRRIGALLGFDPEALEHRMDRAAIE